jgi:hypothetical protein
VEAASIGLLKGLWFQQTGEIVPLHFICKLSISSVLGSKKFLVHILRRMGRTISASLGRLRCFHDFRKQDRVCYLPESALRVSFICFAGDPATAKAPIAPPTCAQGTWDNCLIPYDNNTYWYGLLLTLASCLVCGPSERETAFSTLGTSLSFSKLRPMVTMRTRQDASRFLPRPHCWNDSSLRNYPVQGTERMGRVYTKWSDRVHTKAGAESLGI